MFFWENNSKISITLHFTYHDIDLKSLPCCLPWLFSIKCPFLYHFIFAPTIGLALKLHVKVTSSPSMAWMISVVPLGFKISGLNLTLIVVVCLRWTPFLSSRALKVNFFQKGFFYVQGGPKRMAPLTLLSSPKTVSPRAKLHLKKSKLLVKSFKMRYCVSQ